MRNNEVFCSYEGDGSNEGALVTKGCDLFEKHFSNIEAHVIRGSNVAVASVRLDDDPRCDKIYDFYFDRDYYHRALRASKKGNALAKRRLVLMTRLIVKHGLEL